MCVLICSPCIGGGYAQARSVAKTAFMRNRFLQPGYVKTHRENKTLRLRVSELEVGNQDLMRYRTEAQGALSPFRRFILELLESLVFLFFFVLASNFVFFCTNVLVRVHMS